MKTMIDKGQVCLLCNGVGSLNHGGLVSVQIFGMTP